MAKHYDKQFKLDAVQYYHDHLGLQGCATNLGISQQTLSRWQKELLSLIHISVFLDDGDDMQFYNRKKAEVAKSIADVLNEKVGEKQSVSDPKEEKKTVSYTHLTA